MPDADITKLQGLANIKTVEEGELNLSEEGELSIVAIDQSKVTGLSGALAGKVNVEAGKSLVSDELITKLTDSATIKYNLQYLDNQLANFPSITASAAI